MQLNIKDKLEQRGITKYDLAKRIGVTYQTISNIYFGKSLSIKLEILDAICRELECTPNDIIITDDPTVNQYLERFNRIMKYYEHIKKDDSK